MLLTIMQTASSGPCFEGVNFDIKVVISVKHSAHYQPCSCSRPVSSGPPMAAICCLRFQSCSSGLSWEVIRSSISFTTTSIFDRISWRRHEEQPCLLMKCERHAGLHFGSSWAPRDDTKAYLPFKVEPVEHFLQSCYFLFHHVRVPICRIWHTHTHTHTHTQETTIIESPQVLQAVQYFSRQWEITVFIE